MLDLVLTRHGLTTAGDAAVLGSRLDVPLAPEGRAQALALAKRLEGVRIDRVISSPLSRALETARIVAPGRRIELDDRLVEMDYGRWEGLTSAEIEARDSRFRAQWERDPDSIPAPGGERGDDVAVRARSFLADLLAAELPQPAAASPDGPSSETSPEGSRHVLVVAHATFNRILLCVALSVPVKDFRRRFVQDRANLTVLRYEAGDAPEGARLAIENEISHLPRPGQVIGG
jgi:broad specificity phosphatase PhoE